jgi:hypothetical protein
MTRSEGNRLWTKGPWRVDPHSNCDVQSGDGTLEIATTHQDILNGGYRDPVTAQADANLIAAAPDLYEALDDILIHCLADIEAEEGKDEPNEEALTLYRARRDKAQAALRKARGETND